MKYGKALRIIRSARNISQKELSIETKLDPSYISLLEKDKRIPSLDTLQKIVSVLGVPIHLFFLLASDEEDLAKVTAKDRNDIGQTLLELLLSAEQVTQ